MRIGDIIAVQEKIEAGGPGSGRKPGFGDMSPRSFGRCSLRACESLQRRLGK